jgi:hypothetical protein
MKKYNQDIKNKIIETYINQNISLSKLAKDLNIDRETITRWINEANIPKNNTKCNKYEINSSIFNIIDNEEKAYWLGFLYADGSINDINCIELSLKLSDIEHLKKFKKFLSFKGNIFEDTKVGRCRLMFKDNLIGENLKNLGCIPRKSLILKFPTENQVPKEFQKDFIRGYFDGDGHIKKIEYSIGVSLLGTKEFLSSILNIIKNDSVLKIKNSKGSSNIFYFQLSGQNSRNFLLKIYNNSNIYLDRKFQLYLKQKERCNKKNLRYDNIKKMQWELE